MEKLNINTDNKELKYFKPKYNKGKFVTIFINISNFFTLRSNFLTLLKDIKDPFFKEVIILMRKYQNSFEKFYLNNDLIIDTIEMKGLSIPKDDKYDLFVNSFVASKLLISTNLENIEENRNNFTFILSIVPKTTKQEANIICANDNIELEISFTILINEEFQNMLIEKETNIECLNQNIVLPEYEAKRSLDVIFNQRKKIIINLLNSYIIKNISNPINGLNKFLNDFENYFASIINSKLIDDSNLDKDNKSLSWSQEEQERFEGAIRCFKEINDVSQRFNEIAKQVKTKSAKECFNRYKYLANKYSKNENKNIDVVENKVNENTNNSELNYKSKEDQNNAVIKNLNKDNDCNTFNKYTNKKDNTVDTKKLKEEQQSKNELIKSNKENAENYENISLTNLILDISKEFKIFYENILMYRNDESLVNEYKQLNLVKKNTSNITKKLSNNDNNNSLRYSDVDDCNELEDELNDNVYDLDYISKNKKDNDNSYNLNYEDKSFIEDDKEKDYKLNKLSKQTLSQLDHLNNILVHSNKYTIHVDHANTFGIVNTCLSPNCNFYISCEKCKKTHYTANFINLKNNSNHVNLYYHGASCPKCLSDIFLIIKPLYFNSDNEVDIAEAYLINCEFVYYMPSNFISYCYACQLKPDDNSEIFSEVTIISKNVNTSKIKYTKCHYCSTVAQLKLGNILFKKTNNLLKYKYLDYISGYKDNSNFKKITMDLLQLSNNANSNSLNYNKIKNSLVSGNLKLYKPGVVGTSLPLKGTCDHYSASYKWYRFSCCSKLYPCDICHDQETKGEHDMELAKFLVCGHCSTEQPVGSDVCIYCKNYTCKSKTNTNFWEGGKGQSNKNKLNSKDKHKFTGLNKTISNKAKIKNKKK